MSVIFAVCTAIGEVNQGIVNGDLQQLLLSLQCEDTRLNGILPENVQWYMDVLSKAIKDKAEVYFCSYTVSIELLDKSDGEYCGISISGSISSRWLIILEVSYCY